MHDLRKLWEIGGLVEDQNNDSVPDRVNVTIELRDNFRPLGLIDFCARLGFETTSLSCDFLAGNKRYAHTLLFQQADQTDMVWEESTLVIGYTSENELSEFLRFLAGEWHESYIESGRDVRKIVYTAGNVSVYSDGEELLGSFKENNRRVDKESTEEFTLHSLTRVWDDVGFLHAETPEPTQENAVGFHIQTKLDETIWNELYYGAARVGMESTTLAFPLTGARACHPVEFIFTMDEGKGTIELQGNQIVFAGESRALKNAVAYFFRENHWAFGGHFAHWEQGYKKLSTEEVELFQYDWEDQGELNEIKQCIKDHADALHEDAAVEIYLSEPTDVRENLYTELKEEYGMHDLRVRSAFKPGYFWMMEEVVPALQPMKNDVSAIQIICKDSQTDDGLELPIRWIQEMYPIDEVLADTFQISSDRVQFDVCKALGATYEIHVFDRDARKIFTDMITIPVSKVPYVQEGAVSYPTTSFIEIQSDETTIEHYIQTDRERFYMYYLEEVLPTLWNTVKDTIDKDSGFVKPLFDRIEIELEMSEEEQDVPVEEERISSLEALHEDLYFNTLDYFAEKGKEKKGKGYEAPGGIYPFLKVVNNASPKASITAYQWIDQSRKYLETKKILFEEGRTKPSQVICQEKGSVEMLTIDVDEECTMPPVPHYIEQPKEVLPVHWLADYSYRGEPIYVYELFKPVKEDYYSAIKLSVYKPTILIETGHHANEVSSMPAVKDLVDSLHEEHADLLNHINLVVIPCANPDGLQLQRKLAKDNPKWKHHAARYNAVGLEYTDVRYRDSVFGEANIVPKIMNRWTPDIVIDNHGIPSHEWTQPFAGYHIPPRFHMSFWIPNAFLYGIAKQLDETSYPQQNDVLNQMIASIYGHIESTDIHEKNKYWMERYVKYGQTFMPEVFPIEAEDDFIFYKWDTPTEPHAKSSIGRFPDWVSADIISEVVDETVYDDMLDKCKKAQYLFNLGSIDWIKRNHQKVVGQHPGKHVSIERKRPLQI